MQNNDLIFEKSTQEMEKRVDNFAKETLNEVENSSRMLSTTMGQITNVTQIRKHY